MQNYKFIPLIALSAFFASCINLEFGPTNTGVFSADDLPSYRNNYQRIASYQFNPGHFDLLNRGRVEMTGMYSLKDSTTAGLTQLGQIDLVIDFRDSEETRPGTDRIPIVDGQISRVTDLVGGRVPEVGVGWSGTLEIPGGDVEERNAVSITEPVGADNPPQLITFVAKGTLTSISPDGEHGSQRLREMSFSGVFVQQFESGRLPLSVVGHIDSTDGQSDFYLEEVR